jgi:tryptophanyl-tRNA synthetase
MLVEKFKTELEKYNYYINNLSEIDALLQLGAEKAKLVANEVLGRVRETLGFS